MATQTVNQTTTNIPSYIKPYVTRLLGKSEALSKSGYVPYEGQRIAGLSGMQQTAMQDAANMAPSAYTQTAGGIAGAAATNAANVSYDPYQTGQFTGQAASQYMNPFMQNVVDVQQREAQRQADIASTGRNAQAVRAGAFGGSRQGVMDAEAARNLSLQKGDIQARGLNQAFQQAQQQFNTEQQLGEQSRQYGAGLGMQGLQTALQGAGQLGVLGQQQFGQQMDINQLQAQYGGQQQGLAQAQMDLDYGDFQRQQQYPYQQLSFLSDMYRGLPMANTTSSMYATPPSMLSQLAGLGLTGASIYGMTKAKGGTVKSYAKGGIAGLNQPELSAMADGMSDPQLQQTMQLRDATDLARMTLQAEQQERDRTRQAMAQMQAMQQAQGAQPTVAQQKLMEMGLAGMPEADAVMPDGMAGGGIVAFADGGLTMEGYEQEGETLPERFKRMQDARAEAASRAFNYSSDREAMADRERISALDEANRARFENPRPTPEGSVPTTRSGIAALADDASGERVLSIEEILAADEGRAAAQDGAESGIAGLSAPSGRMYGQDIIDEVDRVEKQQEEINAASAADAEARLTEFEKEREAAGEYGTEREEKLKEQEAGLEQRGKDNVNMAMLKAGLAIMGGTSGNAFENLAKGMVGVEAYAEGKDKINAAKEKIDESLVRIEEIRREESMATGKERRDLKAARDAVKRQGERALLGISKDLRLGMKMSEAKTVFEQGQQNYRSQLAADAAKSRVESGLSTKVATAVQRAYAADPEVKALTKKLELPMSPTRKKAIQDELADIRTRISQNFSTGFSYSEGDEDLYNAADQIINGG